MPSPFAVDPPTGERAAAPAVGAVEKLDEVTGIGIPSAQEIIAEIGVNMDAFPTAAHLVSWAKFAPIDQQSAGRNKGGSTGKDDMHARPPQLGARLVRRSSVPGA